MERPFILIVDDNSEHLQMLTAALISSGFRVAEAQSGQEALQRVEELSPDLILLDILMPRMDGFETCRRLKQSESDAIQAIPVIFMTALADLKNKIKGFEVGGVDYITKPFEIPEVLARIRLHLHVRNLQRQLLNENERFQQFMQVTLEGLILYNQDHIVEVNPVIEKMLGYSRKELLNKRFADLLRLNVQEMLAEHLCANGEPLHETEIQQQNGVWLPVEIQVRKITWYGSSIRVASIRDIRWRKAMQQHYTQIRQDRYKFGCIVGKSQTMQTLYTQIEQAIACEASVLIVGESGTGKELVARTIHEQSERKLRAFVVVNCGAVPEPLFEREFFGHRKGAFTGADRDRAGYFDLANGGTLFLDEVGELSPVLQVKLLRSIEGGEYLPLGENRVRHVDTRIIAATNKDLKQLVRSGLMREDFFWRLWGLVIQLPPLREHREDIPLLIEHTLQQMKHAPKRTTLPGKVLDALYHYDWPGNVRELQHELERYLATGYLEFVGRDIFAFAEEADAIDLKIYLKETFRNTIECVEIQLLTRALEKNRWHQGRTAVMLGMPEKTLYNKIKKYGLKLSS